ncbi:hypothetical protein A2U01_0058123, partial [Trifolium medium]|nr:hypothetical protein [Trifolium medium]
RYDTLGAPSVDLDDVILGYSASWALLDDWGGGSPQLLGFRPSPKHEPPKSLCSSRSIMT